MKHASTSRQGPIPVLFTHYGDAAIRGSEQVLLDVLHALDRDRFRPVLWCNTDLLAKQARDAGIVTHQSPMWMSLTVSHPAMDVAAWWRQVGVARALASQHGIRLLHANSAAPVQWLAPAARMLRLPLLAHLHAPYLRRDRFALLLHQADIAVGVSAATLDGLATDGMAPTRLRLIPNGIDPDRLLRQPGGGLRGRLGIPPDAFVAGCVGSLIPRKGLDVVLAALARLGLSRPAHLLFAGSGPDQPGLERSARDLGLGAQVHFLGNTDNPAEAYGAMDVNILASRQEAFGLVLVEAALCGVPSVGSKVGGIPEVIVDGVTGLLFPPGDADALANALRTLACDGVRCRTMGLAARDRAHAQFTAARMVGRLGEVYDELLGRPCSGLGMSAAVRSAMPYLRLPLGARPG